MDEKTNIVDAGSSYRKTRWIIRIVFLLIVVGYSVFSFLSSEWFGCDTFNLSTIPLAIILIFGIAAFIRGNFQKKAEIEAEDRALLEKRKERSRTFESEDVLFTADRTLKNYTKYGPYFICIISALTIIGTLIYYWFKWSPGTDMLFPENANQAAFVAVIVSFISLFAGVFCVGQSREKAFRWYRPLGVWLVLFALLMISSAVAVLFKQAEIKQWDYYLSRTFYIIFAILAAELLINFIIEFYRPRTGIEERPIFESRILALLSEPGGVMRNIADTLDYQFGFQVSGTWIYMFLEKSIAPLLLMWLGLFWLFTAVDEVAPGEMGVRETFGKHSEEVLEPSVYLKWPWPIQTIRKIPVTQIQQIDVGPELKDDQGKEKKPDVVLWTVSHYAKEGRFLIATEIPETNDDKADTKDNSPVSMIAAYLPVQYKVKPDGVLDYAYKHEDSKKTLKQVSEKEITRYFASADMLKLMSSEREQAISSIKENIQTAANEIELGVEIVAVAFIDAHPPIDDNELPQAFQEVVGAQEEKEAEINDAKAYRAKTIPQAEADALQLKLKAEAYKNERTKVSKAEIKRFKDRMAGYRKMPEMYILNTKLDFLENDCKDVRKYIVPDTAQNDVYVINLEEKDRPDLLDISDFQEETNNNQP